LVILLLTNSKWVKSLLLNKPDKLTILEMVSLLIPIIGNFDSKPGRSARTILVKRGLASPSERKVQSAGWFGRFADDGERSIKPLYCGSLRAIQVMLKRKAECWFKTDNFTTEQIEGYDGRKATTSWRLCRHDTILFSAYHRVGIGLIYYE
jgi:hypothetical protein